MSGENSPDNGLEVDHTEQNQVRQEQDFKISFLCSLIPKSFDGNRLELYEFISNCDNANKFASNAQKEPLLAFIISRLTGNAKAQLRDKIVDEWEELQNILLQLYSDKKHYTQLMEELNTIKQSISEPVVNFYNRIENLTTRILNSISNKSVSEKRGRSETISEIALQRFMYHSLPDISRFLRGRDFSTISSALTAALEEERALQMYKNTRGPSQFSSNFNKKFCTICRRTNHNTNQCFRNKQKPIHQMTSQQRPKPNFCDYCKKPYHTIDKCFKKQNDDRNKNANDERNKNARQSFSRGNIHLNDQIPQNNVVSVELAQ